MPCTFEEFRELIGLHKYYLDLLISSASFLLGIVGAVFAYVAKARLHRRQRFLSLVVPIALSASASFGYGSGYFKLRELETWVSSCKSTLKLAWAPHAEILPPLSFLFSLVAALVFIGLIAILIHPKWLPPAPPDHAS